MRTWQPSILPPPPPAGHALTFRLRSSASASAVLAALGALPADQSLVVGLGAPLVSALGRTVAGLLPFAAVEGPGVRVPATQDAVWAFVRADVPGDALERARRLAAMLDASCTVGEDVPTFTYREGRDLTGYLDGTENPEGEDALAAAFVADGPLAGSSFVSVQRWIHDMAGFERLPERARDEVIGRARATNDELPDAPPSAHVRRAAQEDYDPPAFMVRRSMPYGHLGEMGLYFVAYGADLGRFERVLRRMAGADDGVVDAMFRFSRPVSGGAYWCPPVREGRLDLRALGA